MSFSAHTVWVHLPLEVDQQGSVTRPRRSQIRVAVHLFGAIVIFQAQETEASGMQVRNAAYVNTMPNGIQE